MIHTTDLTKTFTRADRPIHAVDHLTLHIPKGKITTITGRSGSGKSTLLHILAALLKPTSGSFTIENQNPYELSSSQRNAFRAENIGFLYPDFRLLPYLSTAQNISTPALALNWPKSKIQTRTQQLLEQFDLTDRATHLPSNLSSGEQQRTALARALFANPKLIIADEPTGNLDQTNTEKIIHTLQSFTNLGNTVIIATHDPLVINSTSSNIHLTNGQTTA